MPKLNQILAIEKGTKSRVYAELSEVYKTFQKPALFQGLSRQYQKKDEEGEDFPPEQTRVQQQAENLLEKITEGMTEVLDVTAAKDWANCEAKADVKINGAVVVANAPATYLLFLEKQLSDLKAEIDKMPELDPSHVWHRDPESGLQKADPVTTSKTKKVPKVIVKYEATEHHPAQTELVHLDEVVGTWTTVLQSGAIPATRKKELQKRLQELTKAVKFAREEANAVEAPKKEVAKEIFNYLLA
jgi:hypothetical protein